MKGCRGTSLQAIETLLTEMIAPGGLFQISMDNGGSHAMMVPLSSANVENDASKYINFTGNNYEFVTLLDALEHFTCIPCTVICLERKREEPE